MTEPTSNPLESAVQGATGAGGTTPSRHSTYPIPRPANSDDDSRFTFGLALDVAEVLLKHGYPPVAGTDAVALMRRLYDFVYGPDESSVTGGDTAAITAVTSADIGDKEGQRDA